MRDCAGLDSSPEDSELDSAGPGDGLRCGTVSDSGDLAVVEVMGNDESRLRDSLLRPASTVPGRDDDDAPAISLSTAVLVDALRDTTGRSND